MITSIKTYSTPKGWVIQMDLEDGSFHSMAVDRGHVEQEIYLIRSGMEFFVDVLRTHHRPEIKESKK